MQRKKRRIQRRLKDLPANHATLFEDETDLLLLPVMRAGWALRGEDATVQISGKNERRALFGVINMETGCRRFLPCQHKRSADFQFYLCELRRCYGHRLIALVLDEASCHTAIASQNRARTLEIELLWLPNRSPHLNPMDHLWRHDKQTVSSNYQYPSLDDHVKSFIDYLLGLSPVQALSKAGILSEDF